MLFIKIFVISILAIYTVEAGKKGKTKRPPGPSDRSTVTNVLVEEHIDPTLPDTATENTVAEDEMDRITNPSSITEQPSTEQSQSEQYPRDQSMSDQYPREQTSSEQSPRDETMMGEQRAHPAQNQEQDQEQTTPPSNEQQETYSTESRETEMTTEYGERSTEMTPDMSNTDQFTSDQFTSTQTSWTTKRILGGYTPPNRRRGNTTRKPYVNRNGWNRQSLIGAGD